MPTQDLLRFLRETPFLQAMSTNHIEWLAEHCILEQVPAGKRILTIGKSAKYMSIIRSGEVELGVMKPHGMVVVFRQGAYGFLGWSALLPPHEWSYDAVTAKDTEFIMFDGVIVRELCEADPNFGVDMMTCLAKEIASRLNATRASLVDNYC